MAKKGRPVSNETEKNTTINIVLSKADLKLLKEAKQNGKVFSISEAIRQGLKVYLKQIGA